LEWIATDCDKTSDEKAVEIENSFEGKSIHCGNWREGHWIGKVHVSVANTIEEP
jgi:hypothetical protein